MAIWIWEAGNRLGITDDGQAAMAAAAAELEHDGQAARAERVSLDLDGQLSPVYRRSGIGYEGHLDGGRVVWDDLRPAVAP